MKFVTLLNILQSKNQSINNTITVCVRSNVHQLIKVGRIYPAQYRTLQGQKICPNVVLTAYIS